MHQAFDDFDENAHKKGGTQSNTQLNAGPWKNLDKKRREERDKKRARFNVYAHGWDAFFADKPCEVPETFNVSEGVEWRKGYLAACKHKAWTEQVQEEIRTL